jgi:hypothetical protein
MDNAPYHNKNGEGVPGCDTIKKELQIWLKKNNVPFGKKTLKPELWKLAKGLQKANPKYEIDKLITGWGHKVLRLPPYHCELNPIGKLI